MDKYQFIYEGKTYELGEDNCSYFENHQEQPVAGIELTDIIELLKQAEEVLFSTEYFNQPCENCLAGKAEKAKVFPFLEYHFYIYTKNGQYVSASIAKASENVSYTKLVQKGQVDQSYIASVIVCANCGEYSVEIDKCEI